MRLVCRGWRAAWEASLGSVRALALDAAVQLGPNGSFDEPALRGPLEAWLGRHGTQASRATLYVTCFRGAEVDGGASAAANRLLLGAPGAQLKCLELHLQDELWRELPR